jgi:hypothetical protein
VTLYLLLAFLVLATIVPSFAGHFSLVRVLRFLFVLAVYPLFVVIGLQHGAGQAVAVWLGLAGTTLLLEYAADALLPTKDPAPLLKRAALTALLWPLVLPAVVEALLIHARLAPPHPPVTLPEPQRGQELFRLPDDELLVEAYQVLAAEPELTKAERTLWLAETFSREVHSGGLSQWLSNPDGSLGETEKALREVGAPQTANALLQASQDPTSVSDDFLYKESQEDLTRLNAAFARRNRVDCPALNGQKLQGA